jgi:ERCC4-type nuclease
MTDGPLIIVDDRERDFMPRLLAEYGLRVSVSRLDYGDYRFWPHGLTVALELNSVSDMLGKMRSKRLVAQAQGLADVADLAFIMIRGRYDEDGGQVAYHAPSHPGADGRGWVRSGWNWDSFQSIKTDIMLLGIDFIDCPNDGDAAREIARLTINLSKGQHNWLRQRTRPDVLTLDGEYRNAVWSLCAFDGIGPETAEAMLKVHGSVTEVIVRVVDDPVAFAKGVAGLGPKRAIALKKEVVQAWATP